jgi:SAM-dependent methyltransferase
LRSAEEQNRRYFRGAYETGVHGWQSSEPSPHVAERLDLVAREAPGARLLDLGCGEGRHCVLAAKRALFVTGIDYEPLAIRRALENVRRAGYEENVRLLAGDILAPPFRPGAFDVLLDYGCLHHQKKADWPRYMAAVTTIVKPGGWFILTVFSTHFGTFGPQKRQWHLAHGAYRRFFTAEDITALFRGSFDLVRLDEERAGPRGFWHAFMRRNTDA